MTILEALVEKKIITKQDALLIEREVSSLGLSLEDVLKRHGISDEIILKIKSDTLGLPLRSVNPDDVPYKVLEYIPEESANHYKIVPIAVEDGVLAVGITDPDNIEARDALNFISSKIGMPYKLYLISSEDFEKILGVYKGMSAEVTHALSDLETELEPDVQAALGDDKDTGEETPVKLNIKDKTEAKLSRMLRLQKLSLLFCGTLRRERHPMFISSRCAIMSVSAFVLTVS